MACSSITLKGINTGCKDNMGGIKEIYLIKADGVSSVDVDTATGTVTSISLGTQTMDNKFCTYKFRKGTSNMSSTMTTDEAAGTMSVQTDVALQFSKLEAAKRLEITAMCMDETVAIVRDSNDIYHYLGYDYPITASAATANTGTAFADFSGYNVTLTDNSKEFPYILSEEAVVALRDQVNSAPVA